MMHSGHKAVAHRILLYAFILLVIILCFSLPACIGRPTVQWSRTFSVPAARSVQQTADSGYIMCGINVLMKTDSAGSKVWDKTLATNVDFYSVQQTTDDGYAVCGSSYEPGVVSGNAGDIWLIKTNANGNKAWEKTFNGAEETFSCLLQQTTDGGYIIGATTKYNKSSKTDLWLIKTDISGNKLWDRIFGGNYWDRLSSVQQTKDNGYLICGSKESDEFYSEIWLIKTDVDGNEIWEKTFINEDESSGSSAQQTTDGGYVVCGSYQIHSKHETDIWLIKTDANGNRIWDKTVSAGDMGISAQQTQDGSYIVYGEKYCPMESLCLRRVSLIKTDANGSQLWEKRFAGKGEAWGGNVQEAMDGGFVICASTGSILGGTSKDALLIKIAPDQR
jgi:hypothetical protein